MYKVNVPDSLIERCQSILNNHDFGNRHDGNGTPEQQLTGLIGQNVMMRLFNIPIEEGIGGADDGFDFVFLGEKIDVKTMGRTTPVRMNYTNNFICFQNMFKPDIYIFCSYNKNKKDLTVCGWIDKKAFKERRKFYSKGSVRTRSDGSKFKTPNGMFEIDNKKLYQVTSTDDLKTQIINFNENT